MRYLTKHNSLENYLLLASLFNHLNTPHVSLISNNQEQTIIMSPFKKSNGCVLTQPNPNLLTYNGNSQILASLGEGTGIMYYRIGDSGDYSTTMPSAINAGNYTLYYYSEANNNYKQTEPESIQCSISKVTPTVIIPTAKVLTYNGSSQELINAGSTNFGTLQYKVDDGEWSTSIPTKTNGGSYTVFYRVVGDSNVNDVSQASVNCSINEKEVNATVELSESEFEYTGSAITPTVTVKDGDTVINPSEYTVTYSNNINVGTGTVTITDNVGGNYNVIGSQTFTIINSTDYEETYLTIESLENSNTISWKATDSSLRKKISISTDNGSTWTEKTANTTGVTLATLNNGDKMLVKGSNTAYGNSSYYNNFVSTGEFNVEGNIMSLCYGDNFVGQTTLDSAGYNFKFLFYNCKKLISAENLILPATTLAQGCYQYMFGSCTSLTITPELPAITLVTRCYQMMFRGCTSLTTAPELPATILAEDCYNSMFYSCSSLTTAPELPATTLAEGCYNSMFRGCTSLTTAPELPATTLTEKCYYDMFYYCYKLTTAPELPATTLAESCYEDMFYDCNLLTTAPELPATTLMNRCYNNMFSGCTSLNYIKCLATDISALDCTDTWVYRVAATGIFVKNASMSSWGTGNDGIPSGWTVQDAT